MRIAIYVLFLIIVGCHQPLPLEDDIIGGDEQIETQEEPQEGSAGVECESKVRYSIGLATTGQYVADDGFVYRVSIHYENARDAHSDTYDAKDIGMIADTMYRRWVEMELPNPQAVRGKLSNFHLVITHITSDGLGIERFARLRRPKLYTQNPSRAVEDVIGVGAFVTCAKSRCYVDAPKASNFIMFLKHFSLQVGDKTIVHELIHPAAFTGLGDCQGKHDDKRLWVRGGFDDNLLITTFSAFWEHYSKYIEDNYE